jgi:hypothetical protein
MYQYYLYNYDSFVLQSGHVETSRHFADDGIATKGSGSLGKGKDDSAEGRS